MPRSFVAAALVLPLLVTIACSGGDESSRAEAAADSAAAASAATMPPGAGAEPAMPLAPDQQALSKIVAEGSTKGISDALGSAQWSERELTMADVRRFAGAVRNLRELQSDPAFQARMGAQTQMGSAGLAATVMAEPRMRQAIESAGLSVDDYVQIAGSLAQAMMVATLMKQPGPTQLTEIPQGVSKANVALVQANEAEVMRILSGNP